MLCGCLWAGAPVTIGVPAHGGRAGPSGLHNSVHHGYVLRPPVTLIRPPSLPCPSNFITDRPSSRVLAPPGGVTSWSLGGDMAPPAPKPRPTAGVGWEGC